MATYPEIPILCDISHICGNPALFPHIAQKAMDLNMTGLHIEVHPEPSKALSDANQQITVEALLELISGIEYRQPSTDNPDFISRLEELRSQIDTVDAGLLKGFFKRMELVRTIGELKKKNQVTILQVNRWQEIVEKFLSEGRAMGLNEDFLKGLLNAMHDESMRTQHDVMNRENTDPTN